MGIVRATAQGSLQGLRSLLNRIGGAGPLHPRRTKVLAGIKNAPSTLKCQSLPCHPWANAPFSER